MIAGKDKGKKGKVARVLKNENKVLVEGVNIFKKHKRAGRGDAKGSVAEVAMPLNASNVMILDPKSGKQTRTGSKVVGSKKIRIAKKSGQEA